MGPIGSAVLTLMDTNKQTDKQTDKPNLYIEAVLDPDPLNPQDFGFLDPDPDPQKYADLADLQIRIQGANYQQKLQVKLFSNHKFKLMKKERL